MITTLPFPGNFLAPGANFFTTLFFTVGGKNNEWKQQAGADLYKETSPRQWPFNFINYHLPLLSLGN